MKTVAPLTQTPNQLHGLTTAQALKRQQTEGFNELPSQKNQNVLILLFNVLKEPMLLMLLGSGALYLFLGELQDALMLMTFVFVVIGITFYQERKTERALDALKSLSSPRATVIRDGLEQTIYSRELARDDIILLKEGDRVPADAALLSTTNLLVDESILTGESLPVRKIVWDGKTKTVQPGGEDLPFVYSGTMVTQGHALAKVVNIGVFTEMGKIGKSLQTIEEEETLLKKETAVIVRNFATVGVILCIAVIAIYTLTRGSVVKGFLAGISLGMALLPEEFPVVLLIFLTLGAWRMSKRKVLTRKTAAIETLGAATVLCVDKTGTLTQNKMQLEGLMANGTHYDLTLHKNDVLPETYHELYEYALLASQNSAYDPIEIEIKETFNQYLSETEHQHNAWELIKEYPLTRELLALSHVWRSPDTKDYIIAAKGAPEAIADLCHLDKPKQNEVMAQIKTMSEKGFRVLGVAKAHLDSSALPSKQHDYPFEFVGLLGFTDPVRPQIVQSVKDCYSAGVRVIMITGDYPGTAQFIGKQIGLRGTDTCLTGPELAALSQKELRERLKHVSICARVVPEQKLAIVNALKANGEIVAMTGDGVNDAPALKSAHIGIAMGERGTDVAREAADLVLLNDDFFSIASAIRLGRRIFDNLKKAIAFIISVHIPIAGMSLLPVLFHMPIVLFPAHIAFLELIVDPACSVVFESEKEEHNVMNRPPRSLKQPLIARKTLLFSLIQGFAILGIVFTIFFGSLAMGLSENEARTLAFVSIVLGNLLLIVTNLSHTEHLITILKYKNKALFAVIGGSLVGLTLVLTVPFLRSLFSFAPVSIYSLVIVLGATIFGLTCVEGLKYLMMRRFITSSAISV
ncbi:cation-translocating P-type ATPase [Candidatus Roizmanbacteria bacterium]|nr:cation-translocating P-type ATPase [Candidatus Roizmanbacteria bacterium]